MFRIGEFSSLAKITVKTLRFYDEIDLFKPSFVDSNGYRYYTIEQLNDLQTIVALRALDVSIQNIKSVFSGNRIEEILKERVNELEEEIQKNSNNLLLIKKYMAMAKKGEFMKKYQAKEIVLPEYIVYYRHGTIESMKDLFQFVLDAGAEAKKFNKNLECEDYCFITYSSKEYKEKDVELEYCEAVKNFGKESTNIKFKKLESHKAISVIHKGAYSKLGEAYAYAVNWVKENGLKITGDIREIYISGCWDKENEDEYITEIQIPVE